MARVAGRTASSGRETGALTCKDMSLPYKGKVACPGLVDADERHETPGSETKDFMTLDTVSSLALKFPSILFVLQVPRG